MELGAFGCDEGVADASEASSEPETGRGSHRELCHAAFAKAGSAAASTSVGEAVVPSSSQEPSLCGVRHKIAGDYAFARDSVGGVGVREVPPYATDNPQGQTSFPVGAASYFFLLGFSSLLPWNFVLSLAPYISTAFFEGLNAENTLLACFQCGALSVQLVLLQFKLVMRRLALVILPAAMAAVALLFAVALTCLPTVPGRVASAHVIAFLFGLTSGSQQSCSFSVGSVMPRNCVGLVSVGEVADSCKSLDCI